MELVLRYSGKGRMLARAGEAISFGLPMFTQTPQSRPAKPDFLTAASLLKRIKCISMSEILNQKLWYSNGLNCNCKIAFIPTCVLRKRKAVPENLIHRISGVFCKSRCIKWNSLAQITISPAIQAYIINCFLLSCLYFCFSCVSAGWKAALGLLRLEDAIHCMYNSSICTVATI